MDLRKNEGTRGPIGVVGLGAVGSTVAQAFEEAGLEVHRYDGHLDIGVPRDLSGCRIVFLCVATPPTSDGALDPSHVQSAVDEIAPHLDRGTVVAVKSTVPPGTSDELSERLPTLDFASVPEFLVQARPMETFTQPDRVVIGARSGESVALIADLMSRVAPGAPILVLLPTEAELVKLASNAMLAAKVSLANELAEISLRYGVSWSRLQGAVGLDRRIGPDHLTVTPERGFAGACLPKDFDGLIAAARGSGYEAPLLSEVARFNRYLRSRAKRSSEAPAGDDWTEEGSR
jgi:UDPglucose 6-dehydrogenase